jgi:WD40 repeat protein
MWDVETGKTLTEPMIFESYEDRAAISADGRSIIIVRGINGTRVVPLRDADNGRLLAELKHEERVESAVFSPDGQRVVTKTEREEKTWDTGTGKLTDQAPVKDFVGRSLSLDVACIFGITRVLSSGMSGKLQFLTIFPNVQASVDEAKAITPICPTPKQKYYMAPEPPGWCITGSGHGLDTESDAEKWQPKWPYDTQAWKESVIAKRAGKNPGLPKE